MSLVVIKSLINLAHGDLYYFKTRWAWQSPAWGRPAPQVRVQNQFKEDEIPLAVMAGRMKKFSENTSTIPEVMDSSKFFLGGGPLSPFGCVLVSLG